MLRDEENYVALFIDWDNLAISTAADFGGAIPDVRAIVKVAQRHGTILLARAYAEWQVPSDRLAVYRAGIDPIYAPTFRFEPDPVNGPARGKSLADPCMVADCIDMLHLLPTVSHFILVSGDKDLIPIVRLAQLRGRKVIVIGPDYVAAILRDMADEYLSYRSLVESGETHSTPEQVQAGSAGPRRRGGRPVSTARAVTLAPALPIVPPSTIQATPPTVQPAPAQPPPVAPAAPARREQPRSSSYYQSRQSAANVEIARPAPAEIEDIAEEIDVPLAIVTPAVEETIEVESPAAETLPAASPDEQKALWETIAQILHEREAQGKPRLRATNLKDLLMARVNGFSERRYGYHKFRDLLAAAEKAGTLEVNRSGPVHWVTLPRHRDEVLAVTPAAAAELPTRPAEQPVRPAELPARSAEQPARPTEQPAQSPVSEESDLELVRFVVDLKNRSRWLTYTYVLTNLIAHLSSQQAQPQQADVEARNALNRLVQQGVLRVDREPREIEVAGARHRVRMCHLEESHPIVQSVLADAAREATSTVTPTEGPRAAPEAPAIRPPEREAREPRPAPEPRPTRSASPPRVILPFLQPSTPPAEPVKPPAEEEIEEAATEATAPEVESASAETPTPAAPAPSALPPLPSPLLAPSTDAQLAPVNPTGGAAAPDADPPPTAAAEADESRATPAESAEAKTPLVQAFEALREVIRGATGPDKSFAGAASVKTRLARRLGTFDERSYGFGKFKDFLLAAQREGFVRVESSGPATRVYLPPEA